MIYLLICRISLESCWLLKKQLLRKRKEMNKRINITLEKSGLLLRLDLADPVEETSLVSPPEAQLPSSPLSPRLLLNFLNILAGVPRPCCGCCIKPEGGGADAVATPGSGQELFIILCCNEVSRPGGAISAAVTPRKFANATCEPHSTSSSTQSQGTESLATAKCSGVFPWLSCGTQKEKTILWTSYLQ